MLPLWLSWPPGSWASLENTLPFGIKTSTHSEVSGGLGADSGRTERDKGSQERVGATGFSGREWRHPTPLGHLRTGAQADSPTIYLPLADSQLGARLAFDLGSPTGFTGVGDAGSPWSRGRLGPSFYRIHARNLFSGSRRITLSGQDAVTEGVISVTTPNDEYRSRTGGFSWKPLSLSVVRFPRLSYSY
jgi:hypothetical protein